MGVILSSDYTQPLSSNGQLLIGKTGDLPVVSNLTAGQGTTITNGAGSISIKSALNWKNSNGEPIEAFNGYVTGPGGTFSLPTTPQLFGNTYTIAGGTTGGWMLTAGSGQKIVWNTAQYDSVQTSSTFACITLVCIDATPGSEKYSVLSTNDPSLLSFAP